VARRLSIIAVAILVALACAAPAAGEPGLQKALSMTSISHGGDPDDLTAFGNLDLVKQTGAGWVQVTLDTDRAGSGLLNLAVDDLAATREELATRGVDPAEIQPVNQGVELSAMSDPDGNTITLIGNFRVHY